MNRYINIKANSKLRLSSTYWVFENELSTFNDFSSNSDDILPIFDLRFLKKLKIIEQIQFHLYN